MLSDSDVGTLRDMLRHIELAEKFGHKRSDAGDELMALYAITRCFEIISEASRRLSGELKARHGNIPWLEMAAAGNFYRHEYEDVLPQRIWNTLDEEIPKLRAVIEKELTSIK